jgi:hypothetical protein
MVVDIEELLRILTYLVGVGAGGVGLARWLARRFDKLIEAKIAKPVNHTSAQLQTSNGHTVAQYIEDLTGQVKVMRDDIGVLTQRAGENRETAKRAEEKADRAIGAVQSTNELLARALATSIKE